MLSSDKRWVLFDPASHDGASQLGPDDRCMFYMRRMHGGWDKGDANQKIFNLKTPPDCGSRGRLYYKRKAVEKFAADLSGLIVQMGMREDLVLVPIPPSKRKGDPGYDSRILDVCRLAGQRTGVRVVDVFDQKESREPYHENDFKRDPEEIFENLEVDTSGIPESATCVFLVDDMLTTGAHYLACKGAILMERPDLAVVGVFWAKQLTYYEEWLDGEDLG